VIDYDKVNFSQLAVNELRKKLPEEMAKELVGVQPMPSDILEEVLKNTKTENDLIREGYEPVSRFKLLWIKK